MAHTSGMSKCVSLDERNQILKINDVNIDLEILEIITSPDARLLWRFLVVEGEVRAVPYTEQEILWMDKPDKEDGR